MRSHNERFLDMLEAINRIDERKPKSKEFFVENELLQVWIVHHLQIVGEAAFKIPKDTRGNYPEIAWGSIIGMRHILVHNYFEIDLEIVWNVLLEDLPILKQQIKQIIESS